MAEASEVRCPECAATVTGVSTDTHSEWFARPGYEALAASGALPVGEPYGRRVPVYSVVTYQPCGHVQYVSPGEPSL